MRRLVPSILSLVPVLLLAACTDTPQPIAPGDAPGAARRDALVAGGQLGDSLPWITSAEAHAFRHGKYLFQAQFTNQDGLGPTFNARSCAQCHSGVDGVFTGTGDRLETHFTRLNADSTCSSLTILGGFVKQDSAARALKLYTEFTTEPLPTGAHQIAHRITPDLFGFGLIAAIPDVAILALADPNDANGDGISGRAHMIGGVPGRFGRKAAAADLDQFNARAYLHEMGITSTLFMQENSVGSWAVPAASSDSGSVDTALEPELDDDDLADVNAFIHFLAPAPSTDPSTADELLGEGLFTSTGCAKCHTPQVYTTVSSIASLNGKSVRPFSDFLLHDMGPQLSPHLGDICLVHASPREFRTEPLMGARLMLAFMHDGLAADIDQAILQHGGEADAARTAYSGLSGAQRLALVAYLETL